MKRHGIKYYDGGVELLQSELLPMFGIIRYILVHYNHFYLACNVLHTVCFNSHFHAYEVSNNTDYTLCTHSDLVDPYVLSVYTLSTLSTCSIPMKYHIIENN